MSDKKPVSLDQLARAFRNRAKQSPRAFNGWTIARMLHAQDVLASALGWIVSVQA